MNDPEPFGLYSTTVTLSASSFNSQLIIFWHFAMDLASIKEQVTNLSLYDLKAGVRKVQNGKATQQLNCLFLS